MNVLVLGSKSQIIYSLFIDVAAGPTAKMGLLGAEKLLCHLPTCLFTATLQIFNTCESIYLNVIYYQYYFILKQYL